MFRFQDIQLSGGFGLGDFSSANGFRGLGLLFGLLGCFSVGFSFGRFLLGEGALAGLGLLGALRELLEAVYPAAGIDEFLLAGVERMAIRTDFRVDGWNGRTRDKSVAANAGDGHFFVIGGVDRGLHRISGEICTTESIIGFRN